MQYSYNQFSGFGFVLSMLLLPVPTHLRHRRRAHKSILEKIKQKETFYYTFKAVHFSIRVYSAADMNENEKSQRTKNRIEREKKRNEMVTHVDRSKIVRKNI